KVSILSLFFFLLLGAALNVNIEPSPVISDLGSDVLLHCSFTVDTPSIDFSFLIVKWFLKGVVLMEFNDKITVSRPRMKMSDTEISKGNASLSISDIRIVDEGDYICSILYTPEKIEKTVSLAVKGNVISESKETDLVCSASGYHPTEITVQWLRNGQVLNDAKLSSLQRNPDNTSSISSTYTFTPTNQDKDKAYSCHVNHTALRKPIEEDILLKKILAGGSIGSTLITTFITWLICKLLFKLVTFIGHSFCCCSRTSRPEVSDIKEIPVSGEDEVKFTVDVSKFYPKEIQIHWSHNGKHLEGKTSEQHCNVNDGTYSVTNQIVIPERELKEKYQIKVTIKHESMEEPAVKEKTLQDPETTRFPTAQPATNITTQTFY
uniref:Ig-like domain-containing protein n=1 Tax=Latimeria chalumnae TaxID=7897 RepID=H3ACB0_LATCH